MLVVVVPVLSHVLVARVGCSEWWIELRKLRGKASSSYSAHLWLEPSAHLGRKATSHWHEELTRNVSMLVLVATSSSVTKPGVLLVLRLLSRLL